MNTHNEEVARVKALRIAFMDGVRYASGQTDLAYHYKAADAANNRYPMPTVDVRRVVKDPEDPRCDWRYRDDGLEARDHKGDWIERPYTAVTPERVAMWADLIANPTERRQVDE